MPKEIINDQFRHKGTSDDPNPDLRVEVSWQREHMDVQIGTVNPAFEQFSEQRGWFAHLDREGVNRLIRTLRRARDQAFGADA